jgi:hypothetical protein
MSGNFSVHGWRSEQRTSWYQFIEGQTHIGMPRGAKMSLALNELHEIGCPLFNFKHAPQVERNDRFCMQKQSMGNNRGPPPDKKSHRVYQHNSSSFYTATSLVISISCTRWVMWHYRKSCDMWHVYGISHIFDEFS